MYILLTKLVNQNRIKRVQCNSPILFTYEEESDCIGSITFSTINEYNNFILWIREECTVYTDSEKKKTKEYIIDHLEVFHAARVPYDIIY